MKYEENENEITFTVDTERLGKWAIIHALNQVTAFWREVAHYATFNRKNFETLTIKINRVGVFHDSSKQKVKKDGIE